MPDAAILLCGGNSARMGDFVEDKMLLKLRGKLAFLYSLEAFVKSQTVNIILFVYHDENQRSCISQGLALVPFTDLEIYWVEGGERRQDSVFNALTSLPEDIENVYIHDCARPLVRPDMLAELHTAVNRDEAASMAHPITDTVKQVDEKGDAMARCLVHDLDRDKLWAMETPQAFKLDLITEAYRHVERNNLSITDDVAAINAHTKERPITLIENRAPNPKLTTINDIPYIEFLIQHKYRPTNIQSPFVD